MEKYPDFGFEDLAKMSSSCRLTSSGRLLATRAGSLVKAYANANKCVGSSAARFLMFAVLRNPKAHCVAAKMDYQTALAYTAR